MGFKKTHNEFITLKDTFPLFKDNIDFMIQISEEKKWEYDASCRQRFIHEDHQNTWREDFERDRARLIHSSGLRRLGDKTQVVGPLYDDFTRTRLTHSLEVAQIGRALATFLGANPEIVDTACLAHDIGHPPYGHNGETALEEAAKEIGGFEGNAQTFRLLVKLEPKIIVNNENYGLNLTRAVLDATCKYPWKRKDAPIKNGVQTKKFGVYEEDEEIFNWVRKNTPSNLRCVEAQIMDLSDDIAYCVHDVEDSIKIGQTSLEKLRQDETIQNIIDCVIKRYNPNFTENELSQALERLNKKPYWMKNFDGSYADLAALKNMTSELISHFCMDACQYTREKNNSEVFGRYNGKIIVSQETLAEIAILKGIAAYNVMMPLEKELEYKWQQKILLDLFYSLNEENNAPRFLQPMFKHEWERSDEKGKQRVIIDQLACLTDDSVQRLYKEVFGGEFLY